jgi:hypothetical protein
VQRLGASCAQVGWQSTLLYCTVPYTGSVLLGFACSVLQQFILNLRSACMQQVHTKEPALGHWGLRRRSCGRCMTRSDVCHSCGRCQRKFQLCHLTQFR